MTDTSTSSDFLFLTDFPLDSVSTDFGFVWSIVTGVLVVIPLKEDLPLHKDGTKGVSGGCGSECPRSSPLPPDVVELTPSALGTPKSRPLVYKNEKPFRNLQDFPGIPGLIRSCSKPCPSRKTGPRTLTT